MEQLNGHEIVFKYVDEDGLIWLGLTMQDMIDSFGCTEDQVTVHVFGDDCTEAYRG